MEFDLRLLIAFLITLVVLIYSYVKHRFEYWKVRGFPSTIPEIPYGNARDFVKKKRNFPQVIQKIYEESKPRNLKHVGAYIFMRPVYIPIDPVVIKHILQADFDHFVNRGTYYNEKYDPLSADMVRIEGNRWKTLRHKVTQTFSSGQMKMMFSTLLDTCNYLEQLVQNIPEGEAMDVKEVLARYATDVIGSCAFGIECNSLQNPDAEFRKYGSMIFQADLWNGIKNFLIVAFPRGFLQTMGLKLYNPKVTEFFMKFIKDVAKYREDNDIYRKDFMHLLLQLKNRGKLSPDGKIKSDGEDGDMKLTINEVAAQAFVFFIGGFETSSTTISFACYELTQHQDIQDKARDEINEVLKKHDGKITYESVSEMKYLEMIIKETLRKYPPLAVLARKCSKNYKIPGTELVLEKDVLVMVPMLGLHYDSEYFPNPEKFYPERFSEENKSKIPQFVYLPFGEGPRNCIGLRFGVLQTKMALITLLKNCKITLSSKTKLPLVLNPSSLITATTEKIWLDIHHTNKE